MRIAFVAILSFLALSVHADKAEVFFSPGTSSPTAAIVRALGAAKSTVLVQAYSFTSTPIAKALVEASQRGVKVSVILDKSQETGQYTSATYLQNNGIAPLVDSQHAIAHNKVMVIDGRTVLTGSFNFTKAAEEKNAENLLILEDTELASRYTANWQEHSKHSHPYRLKAKSEPKPKSAASRSKRKRSAPAITP